MKRDVPEPWASHMVRCGYTDPRKGTASMRALADAVGSTPTTISEMIYATRGTKGDLVRRVADALKVPPAEVARWIGRRATSREPFQAHPDADLLTAAEQRAINELIRAIAAPRKPQVGATHAPRITEAVALRAVAQNPSGDMAHLADDADEQARKAAEEQRAAIAEMKAKKRGKPST